MFDPANAVRFHEINKSAITQGGLHPWQFGRSEILQMYSPELLLDVGANSGQYAMSLRGLGYTGKIMSFEPLEGAFQQLAIHSSQDLLWECHQIGLGSKNALSEIHVAGNSVSSSVLPMLDRHVNSAPGSGIVRTETIRLSRLDSFMKSMGISSQRIYLKIDVQGYEMEVLAGAEKTLTHIDALETELSLVPLYANQPLAQEVVEYLETKGFYMVCAQAEFSDPHSGQLLQINGFFCKGRR